MHSEPTIKVGDGDTELNESKKENFEGMIKK